MRTSTTSLLAAAVLATAAPAGCAGSAAPHPAAAAKSPTAQASSAKPAAVSSSPVPTPSGTSEAPNGYDIDVSAGRPAQIGAPSVDGLGGKFFVDCYGAHGHFVLTAKDGVAFRFSCTVEGVSEGTYVSPKETQLTATTKDPGTMILAWRLVYAAAWH